MCWPCWSYCSIIYTTGNCKDYIIFSKYKFQASVSLLLKKINEDLEYLKESLDIVRENPQYMANELLSAAIQKLDCGQFNQV